MIPITINAAQFNEIIANMQTANGLLAQILNQLSSVTLTANFSKGVQTMANLLEKVGVADVATIVATSSDKGVITTVDVEASSSDTSILTVTKNGDGTFAIDPVAAGSATLTFTGTDSGGEVVNPLVYAVTVEAVGTVSLSATFTVGVVS